MEGKLHSLKVLLIILLALTMVMPILPAVTSQPNNTSEQERNAGTLPQPEFIIGSDLIVSYDESTNANNALHPAVAVAPRGSPYEGCIYVVWDEFDEVGGYREIHFSMSEDGGMTWNHDRDDFMVSNSQKGRINYGPAVKPSIAVDNNGVIHVVWAERISMDGTWEVLYSRSTDNGKFWSGTTTGDILVSHRVGNEGDGQTISAPKIVAGVINGKAPTLMLHVVWTEYTPKDGQEVHYSRSLNGGLSWSGSMEIDDILSIPDSKYAYNPTIAVSGIEANFIHVGWSQTGKYEFNEVYYVSSDSWGDRGSWTQEVPISYEASDGMAVQNLTITGGFNNDVHAVWTQLNMNKAPQQELFYSSSPDNGKTWTGREKDNIISDPDGNIASFPSVSASPVRVQVAWTELDEKSPKGTKEIHTSWSDDPLNPGSWSGSKEDIVVSHGDDWGPANAMNTSMMMGYYKGDYKPVFVWDELNDRPTDKDRVDRNNEIHTNPSEWTLSVVVSGSGYVTKSPNRSTYSNDEIVTLTAYPSAGWSFSYWGGDLSGSLNPETITMTADMSVIAYFTQDQYALTINVYGSGSVVKSPNQVTYTYGQVVTLTATPIFGWSFDHWTGSLVGSVNPTAVTIYGNSVVNAYFTPNVKYLNLTSGWNLVSLPLIQSNTAITSVLSSISGSYDSVKYFNAQDKTDPWKSYRVGRASNDLTNIDHRMAVWIHTTAPCMLSIYGNIPTSTSISLYAGWNLVGYPTLDTNQLVSTAFAGTGYDIVEGYQATSPYVKVLVAGDKVVPGNGYWIHVPADTVWTIYW
jgi:hypothetical protein